MEEKERMDATGLTEEPYSGMAEELRQMLAPFQGGRRDRSAARLQEMQRLDEQKLRAALLLWLQRHYQRGETSLEEAARLLLWARDVPRFSLEREDWAERLETDILRYAAQSRRQLSKGKNPAICARVQVILEEQFETATLKTAADMVGVNSSYLSRTISQTYGCSFVDLLHCRRILAAVGQFAAPGAKESVEAVSMRVGYATVHHFYCVFRRYIGFPPKEMQTLIRLMRNG